MCVCVCVCVCVCEKHRHIYVKLQGHAITAPFSVRRKKKLSCQLKKKSIVYFALILDQQVFTMRKKTPPKNLTVPSTFSRSCEIHSVHSDVTDCWNNSFYNYGSAVYTRVCCAHSDVIV